MSVNYLQATQDLYRAAAEAPDSQLCCVTSPPWRLPDLDIPEVMREMNYGCGSTVHPRDIPNEGAVVYIGVGGGLEILQLAAFARRERAVIGVDTVPEMLAICRRNLALAADTNPWLRDDFVDLRAGDALDLPLADGEAGLVAQNCLFNIFRDDDLTRALREAHRVLRPGGALSLSDPVSERPIPDVLRDDDRLRAQCLSGAISLSAYLQRLVDVGFGTIEVRGRRPYRVLDARRYETDEDIYLESVEVVAYKHPVAADGACIFTGRTAIWLGDTDAFDDGKGHVLRRDVPLPVCDKTAAALAALGEPHLRLTGATWHYNGGGCC